ncbi:uncharacterized protein CTRU02_205113 [Colletotrichum truncatum]|uniref:Uncharacterized protein n=1 Tax=Colletotrichum truncatum TaxID=5467 RepID=A0ACC3Z321_COLTU|nr:uncharacterized protein CTRU02_06058 [Colletotrichum truncatum]KAF6793186.1 hypothetical protein CTRU02_06058 [Colletotrichum truncatum]
MSQAIFAAVSLFHFKWDATNTMCIRIILPDTDKPN